MIVGAEKCMLFEPSSSSSQKFLDLVLPRLAASDSERARFALRAAGQVWNALTSKQAARSS